MFSSRKKRTIPYQMFDNATYGLAAKNARILERVYHKGHAQAWDGKEVLQSLFDEHGLPKLDRQTREALGRVFSIILWGELAAWRISAELADELEPLEAKMAATSQAFDEARHFYVMHDYLLAVDAMPERLPWGAQKLLESVMSADHLAKKLLGMQLMVEPVALTLFHIVKKLDIEPVLTALMPYYERDEARHVALGVQYLPAMLSQMSALEKAGLWAYQMRLLTYEVASNVNLMRDLSILGVNPRTLVEIGKGKQMKALTMVQESLGVDATLPNTIMDRYADTLVELTLPVQPGLTPRGRVKNAINVIRHGTPCPDIDLTPDIQDAETPLVRSVTDRVRRTSAAAA
ncbi:MAG: hypothetical protein ACI9WU_002918 [Myxococcota bacterium]|jgi:hypothetical protein